MRGFLTIDGDRHLRLVDLEIGVEEDEIPGLERLSEEFAGDDVELLGRIGGGDHELDRQAVRARQRRRLERDDLGSRYRAHLVLDHALQRRRARLSLLPEFQHPDRNRVSGRVDLQHLVGFRMAPEDLVRSVRIEFALLQRRVRRRGRQRQDNALVLAGREFGGRILHKPVDAAQHEHGEHRRHRQESQRRFEAATIEPVDRFHPPIDEPGDSFVPASDAPDSGP